MDSESLVSEQVSDYLQAMREKFIYCNTLPTCRAFFDALAATHHSDKPRKEHLSHVSHSLNESEVSGMLYKEEAEADKNKVDAMKRLERSLVIEDSIRIVGRTLCDKLPNSGIVDTLVRSKEELLSKFMKTKRDHDNRKRQSANMIRMLISRMCLRIKHRALFEFIR